MYLDVINLPQLTWLRTGFGPEAVRRIGRLLYCPEPEGRSISVSHQKSLFHAGCSHSRRLQPHSRAFGTHRILDAGKLIASKRVSPAIAARSRAALVPPDTRPRPGVFCFLLRLLFRGPRRVANPDTHRADGRHRPLRKHCLVCGQDAQQVAASNNAGDAAISNDRHAFDPVSDEHTRDLAKLGILADGDNRR